MVLQLLAAETRRGRGQGGTDRRRGAPPLPPSRVLYLYMTRYFPSRPLSESDTSKVQEVGIPLPCLFTSPAGGAQDSRAARACTSVTCNEDPRSREQEGFSASIFPEYPRHHKGRTTVSEELTAQIGPSAFLPAFIAIQPASEGMFMGTLSCGTWCCEPVSSDLAQSAAIPDSVSTDRTTTAP